MYVPSDWGCGDQCVSQVISMCPFLFYKEYLLSNTNIIMEIKALKSFGQTKISQHNP